MEVCFMKTGLRKIAAATLALSMCIPSFAFAADTTTVAEGSFTTSFDVYSPKLTIQVPVNADIRINPIADNSATDTKRYTVASNSLDVWNASVDADADVGIPVNVTVNATLASVSDDVYVKYNTFTPDATSVKKSIWLKLSEAQTAATIGAKTGETLAFDAEKKLNFAQFEQKNAAAYTTPKQDTAITKYGALLSVDIAAPDGDSAAVAPDTKFTSDVTKVTPKVGSFAVTGEANTNADWKADDVEVSITYKVKASKSLSLTTPVIAAAPTFSAASTNDLDIVVPNVGESTIESVIVHNDDAYTDVILRDEFTVNYASNATTSSQTDATITLPNDAEILTTLAGDDLKDKPQDILIELSDGRFVVSTLTVTD